MIDTFESVDLTPGCQVVIRAPHDTDVIGIVASVDAETRTVTFTNGMAYVFAPPAAEPAPAEEEVTP